VPLDELLDGDRGATVEAAESTHRGLELAVVVDPLTVPDAPAPSRGLRMIG
jgi:hypothetical protein